MFQLNVLLYRTIIASLRIANSLLPVPKPLLLSGLDSSLQMGKLAAGPNTKCVMLVTDKVLMELGVVSRLLNRFEELKVQVVLFDEILPDPTDAVIEKGISLAKDHKCEAVIAVGGGSLIDAAKLIAILATKSRSLKSCRGLLKVWFRGLPLYAVPTTAGTGSEATMVAVMTLAEQHQKVPVIAPALVPKIAALDPALLVKLPPAITAATGMDALTHAIEAYTSVNASKETDEFALNAIALIFKHLPVCYRHGDDMEARQAMLLASTYAGFAFTKAGVGYVHAIAHQLGAKYRVPHGLANAIVLPKVLQFLLPSVEAKFGHMAQQVTGRPERGDKFIEQVVALRSELNIPNVVEPLRVEDHEDIAKAALKEAHGLYAVPRYMTQETCVEILHSLTQVK